MLVQASDSGAAVRASPVGVFATTVCSIGGKEGQQRETPEITLSLFGSPSVSVCSGRHSKVPQTVGLKQQTFIPPSFGGCKSRSRRQQGWLLLGPLSLPCSRPPPCCVPTGSSLCASLVSLPRLVRISVLLGQGLTLMSSLTVITSLKAHLQMQSHWGLGLLHLNLRGVVQAAGDTVLSVTACKHEGTGDRFPPCGAVFSELFPEV